MSDTSWPRVAIVDYGMGNMFSVRHACEQVGMDARITACRDEVLAADAVILPGVGAFGDAMRTLAKLDLIAPLQEIASSGKLLVGICLGMQLLMTESHEFGRHRGLGIIEGEVVQLDGLDQESGRLKVPHVGWNRIHIPIGNTPSKKGPLTESVWLDSPLEGLADGTFMYFVHSYYPKPLDASLVLAVTRYGHVEFCSSVRQGNVFACQFHPERSGPDGLHIYRNLATRVRATKGDQQDVRDAGNEVRIA